MTLLYGAYLSETLHTCIYRRYSKLVHEIFEKVIHRISTGKYRISVHSSLSFSLSLYKVLQKRFNQLIRTEFPDTCNIFLSLLCQSPFFHFFSFQNPKNMTFPTETTNVSFPVFFHLHTLSIFRHFIFSQFFFSAVWQSKFHCNEPVEKISSKQIDYYWTQIEQAKFQYTFIFYFTFFS